MMHVCSYFSACDIGLGKILQCCTCFSAFTHFFSLFSPCFSCLHLYFQRMLIVRILEDVSQYMCACTSWCVWAVRCMSAAPYKNAVEESVLERLQNKLEASSVNVTIWLLHFPFEITPLLALVSILPDYHTSYCWACSGNLFSVYICERISVKQIPKQQIHNCVM